MDGGRGRAIKKGGRNDALADNCLDTLSFAYAHGCGRCWRTHGIGGWDVTAWTGLSTASCGHGNR